jgi:uncharacterized protein (DUF488 family)
MKIPTIQIVNHYQLHHGDNEYIGRGSVLENPYGIKDITEEEALSKYEKYLYDELSKGNTKIINELDRLAQIAIKTGTLVLRCYCAPKRCHGEIVKQLLLTAISQQE